MEDNNVIPLVKVKDKEEEVNPILANIEGNRKKKEKLEAKRLEDNKRILQDLKKGK